MPILTKAQLEALNQSSFPDNSTEEITPQILREYNTATIDTLVDSLDTGSFIQDLTSLNSFTQSQLDKDATLATYTGSVNTKFATIGTQSGSWENIPLTSLNAFTQSQLEKDSTLATYTGSVDNSISALNTFSSSQLVKDSTLGLYTASNDTKWNTLGSVSGSWITNAQTSSMSVNFAVTSSKAQDLYVNAKNTSGAIITKGSIVKITGASGDNPEIGLADWTNDSTSANTLGITNEDIAINAFSDIVVQGRVIGLNTNTFTPGQLVYLGSSGSIVASVPPQYHEVRLGQVLRSNINQGSIYLSVDNGYELTELHDVNIVTASLVNNDLLAYDSASQLWTNKSINGLNIPQLNTNNTFTGTNSFQNISAVSASFQYVQSVTGSAVNIGQSFIVLNNDTPTQRYAGLIVIDSGSVNTSASFEFDGQTNDWFYDYTKDGGITTEYAVALFGPEYNTKGSPNYLSNNRIPKSSGSHHLNDSNISDDGTNVSINSNTQITGSLLVNGNAVVTSNQTGSFATTASNTFTGQQNFTQPVTASVINVGYNNFGNGINFFQDGLSQIRFYSGSNATQVGTWVNMQTNPANGALAISSFPLNNHFVDFDVEQTASLFTAPIKGMIGNLRITSGVEITGSLNITPLSVSANGAFPIPFISASIVSKDSVDTLVYNPTTNQLIVSASSGQSQISPNSLVFTSGSGAYGTYSSAVSKNGFVSSVEGSNYIAIQGNPSKTGAPSLTTSTNPGILALSGSGQPYVAIEFQPSASFTDGRVTIKRPLIAESTFTASLQEGYAWVGGVGNITNAVPTSSFGGGGSGAGFPFTGSAEITGSLAVTGSMSGYVNALTITDQTASLNFNDGNFFTLQLVSGSITHLTATNIKPGQAINLLVKMDSVAGITASSGSLSFSPTFKFAGGFDYTPTKITGSQDLVSFVTFDTTQVLAAQVKNLL